MPTGPNRGVIPPQLRLWLPFAPPLESAGVEFIPENGGGAGVRLKKVSAPGTQMSNGEAGIIENNEI